MVRSSTALLAVLALAACAPAADKADGKPLGTWSHKLADDTTVTFTFAADKLKCEILTSSGGTLLLDGAYGVTDDGTVFGVITRAEKKGVDAGPEKGELFGFKVKLDKDRLTVSDYRGSVERPEGKGLIEGEYKKSK
jgi:hypothetical protein